MYQRLGKAAYKADLSNTIKLAAYLGNPEKDFKSIHVGGTNGKGSSSHMLASVLQAAGYKVGLYTSPHLKDFRERIRIDGKMISEAVVVDFVQSHKAFFETNSLSIFEMTVGMAFDVFRREEVDIAVIEVGLGGRLDSTNIITPEVCAITNIGLDHTQFLGTTLGAIAEEKAGIIKTGVPVVIGECHPETKTVFEAKAAEMGAPIYFAEEAQHPVYDTDLMGNYQRANQQTVLSVITILINQGWAISKEQIGAGLGKVMANTGLLGRWQVLQTSPTVICDTAHNREGLLQTMEQLQQMSFDRLHMVLGVVSDKDLLQIWPLFSKDAIFYFCAPQIARAMKATDLSEQAHDFGLTGNSYESVGSAYAAALEEADNEDVIYVGGSTFVVAEVL